MYINNNHLFTDNQSGSHVDQGLNEAGVLLTQDELSSVSGGAYIGLSWFGVAFAAGYAVGTYIDQKYIAPLW